MRRLFVALSLTAACLVWAFGATAAHADPTAAGRSTAPSFASLVVLEHATAAVVPSIPARRVPPGATFALLAAALTLALPGVGRLRSRLWLPVHESARGDDRTRGPPALLPR